MDSHPSAGSAAEPGAGPVVSEVTTKAGQIAQAIEEMIVSGRLRPGTVLRQEELSHRFRVSRTPIREALRQLAALGLVSFVPNRGVRVRGLDRDDWRQAFMARAALEGFAAELAAGRLGETDLSELDAAGSAFARWTSVLRDPDAGGDREAASFAWIAANERFHGVILDAAGVPLIARMVAGVRHVFSGQAVWTPGSAADRLYETNVRQHEAIRHVLAARNAPAARALVTDHILDSWRLLEAILDEAEGGRRTGAATQAPAPSR